MEQIKKIVGLLDERSHDFSAPFGIQIDSSCPNVYDESSIKLQGAIESSRVLSEMGIPVIIKGSVETPIKYVMKINDNPYIDALCVSNTIPFGSNLIDWKSVWGSEISPLMHLGGGGLSGSPLSLLVCDYIKRLRETGFSKPINAGGGILSCIDVDRIWKAGASSIFLSSVIPLRPWRVKEIIRYAKTLSW